MGDAVDSYVRSVARFSDVVLENFVLKNSKKQIKNIIKNEISCQTDRCSLTHSLTHSITHTRADMYLIDYPLTFCCCSSSYLFDENESQTGVSCETIQDQVSPKDAGCSLKDYLLHNHRSDKRIKPQVHSPTHSVT